MENEITHNNIPFVIITMQNNRINSNNTKIKINDVNIERIVSSIILVYIIYINAIKNANISITELRLLGITPIFNEYSPMFKYCNVSKNNKLRKRNLYFNFSISKSNAYVGPIYISVYIISIIFSFHYNISYNYKWCD